ncbi:MAG: ATP-binding protein [Rikenellaceae bacterium]
MATAFMNKLTKQGRIFAAVLLLLWFVVIGFVAFRYWLFVDDDLLTTSPKHLALFDDLFFLVSGVITVLIGVIGFIVTRLYSTLLETLMRVEHEHEAALKQEHEKIRIKRQLTNNINHELKTPICSILGYLEMVLGNDKLDKKTMMSFVKKSYDQAERLRRLMMDLSTITRIDEAASMVERGDVDLGILISTVVDDTLPQAEQQNIAVVSRINKPIKVVGNNTLLYSVFRNLIDNAVAYSGGRMVTISLLSEDSERYTFSIVDNGIGVEDKHLPHLFERFYRVDAGRSRKAGGTGLGLSIVKNAVIFHGGDIVAKRAQKGGLEFQFSIKKFMEPQPTRVESDEL